MYVKKTLYVYDNCYYFYFSRHVHAFIYKLAKKNVEEKKTKHSTKYRLTLLSFDRYY